MINPNQSLQQEVILSQIPISQVLEKLREIIREELKSEQLKELQERFLSPAETVKLFTPKISISTLSNWADQGLLNKHFIGGKTYYRYSEIMDSIKTLSKYKTKSHLFSNS